MDKTLYDKDKRPCKGIQCKECSETWCKFNKSKKGTK